MLALSMAKRTGGPMLYIVLFEDEPARADMRQRHMPDHLAFLERNAEHIRAAGPLRDTADDAPAGGLWLVEADGPAAVAQLTRDDPFWPTGLRRAVRILEWTQVFVDGRRRN
jgi:hypothetical protein